MKHVFTLIGIAWCVNQFGHLIVWVIKACIAYGVA